MRFGLIKWPLNPSGDPRQPKITHALGLVETISAAGSEFSRSFSDFLDLLDAGKFAPVSIDGDRGPFSACLTGEIIDRGYRNVTCTIFYTAPPPVRWSSSVSDTMALLQDVVAGLSKERTVSQTLGLTQAIEAARAVSVSTSLGLSQTIASDLYRLIQSVLAMSDTIGVQKISNAAVSQALGILDAIVMQKVITLSLSDVLALQQVMALIRSLSISHALVLVQSIQRIQPASVAQALALVQTALATAANANASVMTMQSTVGAHIIANRTFTNSLGMTQGVVAWIERSGSPNPCDEAYSVSHGLELALTVTFTRGLSSVTLRAPRFGNSSSVDVGTVVRKNRGGAYKIVKPSAWPTIEILKMSFESLRDDKQQELVAFLSTTSGYEITFLDHESISWTGVITTPVADVAQAMRNCAFEIELEFRGRRT